MRYHIEATIPTQQYGNLKPMIEVENIEEESEAVDTIKRLWDRFGEAPLKDKSGGGVLIDTFTGEQVYFNEETHTYTDLKGNVLMSGSQYANEHSPKFDMEMLLPKTAKAWGVDEAELKEVWKMNGDISNHWGSAIHGALELAHKHYNLGESVKQNKELEHNYVLPKNIFLRNLVEDFIKKFGLNAYVEVVVSDVDNKMVGTVDRLEIIDDTTVRIGDYKTNNEMDKKKLLKYQKQMSFYAHALKNKGYEVRGLDLYYLDQENGWEKTELEVLPLEGSE